MTAIKENAFSRIRGKGFIGNIFKLLLKGTLSCPFFEFIYILAWLTEGEYFQRKRCSQAR